MNDKSDPTQTYVLEETFITRTTSLEELANAAAREISGARPSVRRTAKPEPDLDSTQRLPKQNIPKHS